MGSPHSNETTYLFRYDREADRFTAMRNKRGEPQTYEAPDEAILFLEGDADEFIIFDNRQPGSIDFVSHSADNPGMKRILGLAVLNKMYGAVIQGVRTMVEQQGKAGYQWRGTFPTSVEKHMACLGLHASALGATDEVVSLWRASEEIISQATVENEEA